MKRVLLLLLSIFFALSVVACSPRPPKMEFTASFITYGGTPVPSFSGSKIEEEPAPYKEGFAFEGWYTEEDFSLKRVSFPYILQGDTTFYAKYIDLNIGNEGITYELNATEDGYIATGFAGDSYSVVIPPTYKNLPVVKASDKFLRFGSEVKKIYFSPNLAEIDFNTRNLYFLSEFILTGTSEHYSVSDGILYSADGETLLSYPIAKKGADGDFLMEINIPDTVKTIKRNSFKNSQYLIKIIIGKGVENIEETFETLPYLSEFSVSDNGNFVADNGVLYKLSTGEKTLISYPVKCAQTDYHLPAGTTAIAANALRASSISVLTLNSDLTYFGNQSDISRLREIKVDDDNAHFYADNGVLYSYDDTLILYPSAKNDDNYRVKDGTKYIASYAFYAPIFLKTLTFAPSVEVLRPYSVFCSEQTALSDVVFQEGSNLVDVRGAVFGSGKKISVTLSTRTPPYVDVDATDWLSYVADIKVPTNVVESYKVLWSGAKNIIFPSDVVLPEYTVSFDANGGVPIDSVTCASMAKEVITERSGYVFAGWYIDENKVSFPFAVSSDVTLRAEWTPLS